MDSRLLNVLHDDPFDGTFNIKYEEANFWPSGNDAMGMQLTETLHGILPIAATEDVGDIYESTLLPDGYQLTQTDSQLTAAGNALLYESFTEQQLTAGGIGALEIVTMDRNDDFDSDSEDLDEFDHDEDAALLADGCYDGLDGLEDEHFDQRSQCSDATFRTRTDSSSIGDYESHSSDYEDEGYIEAQLQSNAAYAVLEAKPLLSDDVFAETGILTPEDLMLDDSLVLAAGSKTRTISTNTIGSDVDGLGLAIDANNFDLADFITKDDFILSLPATTTVLTPTKTNELLTVASTSAAATKTIPQVVGTLKYDDSDSDSDVIVDVETVEVDGSTEKSLWADANAASTALAEEDELSYVDNVRGDPSWSPKRGERKKTDTNSKESKSKATAAQTIAIKRQNNNNQHGVRQTSGGRSTSKLPETATSQKLGVAMGIGQGSKNLAFIKHECESISQQTQADIVPVKIEPQEPIEQESPAQATKRKLNLEEYKKRRGDAIINGSCIKSETNTFEEKRGTTLANNNVTNPVSAKSDPSHPTPKLSGPHKHSDAVTSIVRSLKEAQQQPAADPITLARNKVLRMQELKRAQQLKIIDSTVSAKVPRVTKLLPLKDIIKDACVVPQSQTQLQQQQQQQQQHKLHKSNAAMPPPTKGHHTDYEEIIIVSASCNTDISIPPLNVFRNQQLNPKAVRHINDASRSLLKSSVLLYNISNTVQKVQAAESGKISTNSLIVGIQNTVAKTALPLVEQQQEIKPMQNMSSLQPAQHSQQHGEDKIIMHLRKDRVRQRVENVATQTDFQTEFMSLFPAIAPTTAKDATHSNPDAPKRRHHHRRKYKHHSTSQAEYSDEDNYSDGSLCTYRSRSRSTSNDHTNTSGTGEGENSSHSNRQHRSSVSSAYSECGRKSRQRERKRSAYYNKQHRVRKYRRSCSSSSSASNDSSSSTLSDYSGRSRSRTRRRSQTRSRIRSRSRSRSHGRSSHYENWSHCSNRQQSNSNNYSYHNNNNKQSHYDRNVSKPAVEERRIVYVGRIEEDTTKEMLRRKFLSYGPIHQITIHYKETGMKYGFVTYERSQDAFSVIDSGARDSEISMYDISFGGRRAFCRATYADLDNAGINHYHSYLFPKAAAPAPENDSFEALLQKVKAKMTASKTTNAANGNSNSNGNSNRNNHNNSNHNSVAEI